MGVYLSKASTEMEADLVSGNGMTGVVGEIQGWRRNMEDAHIASTDLSKYSQGIDFDVKNMSIFGVFDGHGGKEVAKFTQIKFIREFCNTKAFKEQRFSDALRTAFHRIDDILEDNKYAKLLRRLKELPNPSDNSAGDGEDDDNADKKVYTRFDPTDPQWESEDEGTTASVTPTISRASSVDGANGKKPKKLISKKEAVELFTQLLLEENAARAGQPLPGGSGSARERLLARGQSGSGDDSGDDSGYQQAWEEYFYDPDRIPGDRPRPTQQYRSASISVGDSETDRQCTLREHKVQAGCTAVVALREGNLLYCANAGDSRGVLCREDGKVLALSEDHKPTASTEMKRILDAGGFISSAGRINGNLNLSRSLGDMKYKQVPNLLPSEQIITAEPDITVNEILPGDKFFVLACDGVWDVFENQEICDFIDLRLSSGKSVEAIVEDVFEHCVSDDPRRTQGIGGDNMTCMIILLNQ